MTKTTLPKIFWILWAAFFLAPGQRSSGQDLASPQKAADDVTQEVVDADFNSVIKRIKQYKQSGNAVQARKAISDDLVPYVALVAAPHYSLLASFRSQLQEWRTDVQTESSTSSPGTTSLVSKGSVPTVLGLAVENGALTQTTSGTSVTFRTNPTGLIKALQKYGYAESGPDSYRDPVIRFVRKVSGAVTFNIGTNNNTGSVGQGAQGGTFTGSAQQISGIEFRYDILNHRDPREPRYTREFEDLRKGALANVAENLKEFGRQIEGIPPQGFLEKEAATAAEAERKKQAYDAAVTLKSKAVEGSAAADDAARAVNEARAELEQATSEAEKAKATAETSVAVQKDKFEGWRARAQKYIDDAPDADSVNAAVLKAAKDFVSTFGDDPATKAAANTAAQAISDFLKAQGGIRGKIDKSPILTLEYTDTRQGTMATMMSMASAGASPATPGAKLPDLSNFKLILAGGTVGGTTLTANASLTLFNSNPQAPAKGRIRDFQLSGQADIPLREIQSIGVPTLTFSGLFLSLRKQPLGMPVQVNGVNVNLKGNIGFAQAKISFPVKKGSGVNVPLSVTYASRTELNKEHDIRGSIGMTLDLDSIFAAVKP